ncbi:Rrf2 family transcriptional regulator [Halobacteriovorax sp.]|uniref:Rrf2 family transcriptional regulator n=1 Tax=Halobacteriovorax sp. TaxID=2020862 RepID=UPI003568496D
MKLTTYTDYSIRVLIYLGINEDRICTSSEISESYNISKNHLSKVIHQLSKLSLIDSFKGASGGIKLALSPEEINIGKLVRQTEPDFHIVECFAPSTNKCKISPSCKLKQILNESTSSFLNNLDKYTLKDILSNSSRLEKLIKR